VINPVDRLPVMAGLEADLTAHHEPGRRVVVGRPVLVAHGADDRGAHRLAHPRPRDRRSGVEHGARGQIERFPGGTAVEENGLAVDEALEGVGVRLIDDVSVVLEPIER